MANTFHIIATEIFTLGPFEDPEFIRIKIFKDGVFYKELHIQDVYNDGMLVVTIEKQVEALVASLGATIEWTPARLTE